MTAGAVTGGIQVIARASAILRALESEPSGLSLGEIARRLGLPRSTVQRIVGALAAEHIVMAASPGGHVRLGPALLHLATGARLDLVELARPHLEALSKNLRETVDLSILAGTEAVFVDRVIAVRRLRLVSDIGIRFPLHCTANGKALLALLPDETVSGLLAGRMQAFTPQTQTSLDSLLVELAMVRKTGIAVDREEHASGICAIGVAFRWPPQTLAAMSVPVPVSRFDGEEERITHALKAAHANLLRQVPMPAALSPDATTPPPHISLEINK